MDKNFIGNACLGETALHGEACVEEIHYRGWAVKCECDCHSKKGENIEQEINR